MSLFVDVHCHGVVQDPDIVSVLSVDLGAPLPDLTKVQYFTAGVHPWSAGAFPSPAGGGNIGTGEIGLDPLRGPALHVQKEVLRQQLRAAKGLVVLHCVRLYQDCLAILKESRYEGQVIFHGYNGSPEITRQLLKHERISFSFGRLLFVPNCKAVQSLPLVPLDRLFFETDDQVEYGIREIYARGAQILGVELSVVKERVYENFRAICAANA